MSAAHGSQTGQILSGAYKSTANGPSRVQEGADDQFSFKCDFDDVDNDDELDPVMKEKLDREVEDFARRLNSDWPERMQEILASNQEQRRLVPASLIGDPSLKRFTSMTRT